MNVSTLFKNYAWNVTQLGLLRAESGYVELSAQVLSDMPKRSGISSPVENAIEKSEYDLMILKKEIAKLSWEIAQAEQLIACKLLSDDEMFCLKERFIERRTWKQVLIKYEDLNNYAPSVKILKQHVRRAVKKLQNYVENGFK